MKKVVHGVKDVTKKKTKTNKQTQYLCNHCRFHTRTHSTILCTTRWDQMTTENGKNSSILAKSCLFHTEGV